MLKHLPNIYLTLTTTLTQRATITGNQGKTENGRGIGIYVAEGSIFNVKGKVLIDGNCYTTYSPQQKKTPHNVYLAENEVISIAGALTTGSSIGVEGTDDVVASYADATEAVNENALPSIFKNDTQANVKAYNDGKNQQIRWNTDNKRLLTADGITVILPDEAPVYTGSAIGLEGIVVKDGEDVITEHCEFTYLNNVNAGTANVIISAKEESDIYIGSTTATFTIAQKEVTIKADDKKKTYGDDAPTFTASADGLVDVDAESVISCTFTCEGGEETGEYDIIPSEATIMNGETNVTANYDISYANGKLTVSAMTEEIVVSIKGNSNTTVYDSEEHEVSGYTIVKVSSSLYKVSGDDVDFTFNGTASAARKDVGTTNMELTRRLSFLRRIIGRLYFGMEMDKMTRSIC